METFFPINILISGTIVPIKPESNPTTYSDSDPPDTKMDKTS